jgi:hypothetical protein
MLLTQDAVSIDILRPIELNIAQRLASSGLPFSESIL